MSWAGVGGRHGIIGEEKGESGDKILVRRLIGRLERFERLARRLFAWDANGRNASARSCRLGGGGGGEGKRWRCC